LVDPALLVEPEARAGLALALALERLVRAARADELAGERFDCARPAVAFALGVDFELPLLGCGTFSSFKIDRG
jgi:hypothetical protein